MDVFNELLFIPLRIFFDFPYLAFILAIIFGYIFFKKKKIIIGITALLWLSFGIYIGIFWPLFIYPPEEITNPIPVDLILVIPILIFCIIITAVESIKYLRNVLPQMMSNPRSTKRLLILIAAAALVVGFIFGYYVREIHDDYSFIYNEKIPQADNKRNPNAPPAEKGLELEPNFNYPDSNEKSE